MVKFIKQYFLFIQWKFFISAILFLPMNGFTANLDLESFTTTAAKMIADHIQTFTETSLLEPSKKESIINEYLAFINHEASILRPWVLRLGPSEGKINEKNLLVRDVYHIKGFAAAQTNREAGIPFPTTGINPPLCFDKIPASFWQTFGKVTPIDFDIFFQYANTTNLSEFCEGVDLRPCFQSIVNNGFAFRFYPLMKYSGEESFSSYQKFCTNYESNPKYTKFYAHPSQRDLDKPSGEDFCKKEEITAFPLTLMSHYELPSASASASASASDSTSRSPKSMVSIDPEVLLPGVSWDFSVYGGSSSMDQQQIYYRQKTLKAILAANNMISEGHADFFDVLHLLKSERYQLAKEMGSEVANNFGVSRGYTLDLGLWLSRCSPKYGYKFADFAAPFQSSYPHRDKFEWPLSSMTPTYCINYEGYTLTCAFADDLPEEGVMHLSHTNPSVLLPFLINVVKPEYEKIVHKEYAHDEELYEDLGRLHWFLAQATPFRRGSAAISENLIRALLLSKGREILPFQIMPDLEALGSPNPEEFARYYAEHAFAKKPEKK